MNRTWWTILGLIALVIILYFTISKAHAWNDCHHDCFPTPTATPTITPKPCFHLVDDWEKPCPTVTPTPTPTVIASPSATPTPTGTTGGQGVVPSNPHTDTTEAPGGATCTIAFSPPVLTSITAGGSGTLTLNWLESSPVDKFSLTYGFTGQSLSMGVDNIPSGSTSFTIGDLPQGASINAQVQAWVHGCEESSTIIDPVVN